MSTYGTSTYGAADYGNSAAGLSSVAFTADPAPSGYSGLLLNWSTPGGTWDRLRIVRNRFGFPVTPDDGTVLVDTYSSTTYGSGQYGDGVYGGSSVTQTQFMDTANLLPSTFYYYAMFVRQAQGGALIWTRVAVTIGQSVGDHKYKDWMLERLPSIYTTSGGSVEEGPEPGTSISRFLNVFGSDVNRTRDFLDHLNHVEDPDTVHGDLLIALCQNWGYTYEPAIGMKQNRVIAKNAVYLRQTKGTTAGVQALASAVSGWGAKQLHLINLFLDENDASAEQSIGNWMVTSGQATVAQETTLSFSNGSNGAAGCFKVTCNSGGSITLSTVGQSAYGQGGYGTGPFDTRGAPTYGIPVTVGTQYTVSGYFRSAATTRNPILDIVWYDKTGAVLSTSSGASGAATTTTDWSCRVSTTATAPTSAVWAGVVVRWSASLASSEVQYYDALQFEAAGSASTYTPARQIRLMMIAPRVNEVSNAGFDVDVTQWTTSACTVAWDNTVTYNTGIGAAKVTSTGTAGHLWQQIRVDASSPFAFAAQVFPTRTDTFSLTVSFYDVSNNPLGSVQSQNFNCPADAWTQLTLTGTTPANAYYAQIHAGVPTGQTNYNLDDVQFEMASAVLPYFDLRLNSGDVKWEGAAYNSRLHYYPNFGPRDTRLLGLIPKHIPLGASFSLLFAQPRGTV